MQEITFEQDGKTYKINHLDQKSMTVQLQIYEKGEFIKDDKLPFAHLPKKIKKILNPKK